MSALFRGIFLVTIFVISGCCRSVALFPETAEIPPLWCEGKEKPTGTILLLHGLNQDPRSLDPLCRLLSHKGFLVYRPVLEGHAYKTTKDFPAAIWSTNAVRSARIVHEQYPNLPFHIVGYSLGGLLAVTTASTLSSQERPVSMVLLAPALSLRALPALAGWLGLAPRSTVEVPNLAPQAYRRFATTPLFWYANILELYEHRDETIDFNALRPIPTLVVLNSRDELISSRGVQEWMSEHNLSPQWRAYDVQPHPSSRVFAEHLIVDERSVGPEQWKNMFQTMVEFLKTHYSVTQSASAVSGVESE